MSVKLVRTKSILAPLRGSGNLTGFDSLVLTGWKCFSFWTTVIQGFLHSILMSAASAGSCHSNRVPPEEAVVNLEAFVHCSRLRDKVYGMTRLCLARACASDP
jgi:hypothetical protein